MTGHDLGYRLAERFTYLCAILFFYTRLAVTHSVSITGHCLWFLWYCLEVLFWYLRPLQCCSHTICLSLDECMKFLLSLKWSCHSRESAAPKFVPVLSMQSTGSISPCHHFGFSFWQSLFKKWPLLQKAALKNTSRSRHSSHEYTEQDLKPLRNPPSVSVQPLVSFDFCLVNWVGCDTDQI